MDLLQTLSAAANAAYHMKFSKRSRVQVEKCSYIYSTIANLLARRLRDVCAALLTAPYGAELTQRLPIFFGDLVPRALDEVGDYITAAAFVQERVRDIVTLTSVVAQWRRILENEKSLIDQKNHIESQDVGAIAAWRQYALLCDALIIVLPLLQIHYLLKTCYSDQDAAKENGNAKSATPCVERRILTWETVTSFTDSKIETLELDACPRGGKSKDFTPLQLRCLYKDVYRAVHAGIAPESRYVYTALDFWVQCWIETYNGLWRDVMPTSAENFRPVGRLVRAIEIRAPPVCEAFSKSTTKLLFRLIALSAAIRATISHLDTASYNHQDASCPLSYMRQLLRMILVFRSVGVLDITFTAWETNEDAVRAIPRNSPQATAKVACPSTCYCKAMTYGSVFAHVAAQLGEGILLAFCHGLYRLSACNDLSPSHTNNGSCGKTLSVPSSSRLSCGLPHSQLYHEVVRALAGNDTVRAITLLTTAILLVKDESHSLPVDSTLVPNFCRHLHEVLQRVQTSCIERQLALCSRVILVKALCARHESFRELTGRLMTELLRFSGRLIQLRSYQLDSPTSQRTIRFQTTEVQVLLTHFTHMLSTCSQDNSPAVLLQTAGILLQLSAQFADSEQVSSCNVPALWYTILLDKLQDVSVRHNHDQLSLLTAKDFPVDVTATMGRAQAALELAGILLGRYAKALFERLHADVRSELVQPLVQDILASMVIDGARRSVAPAHSSASRTSDDALLAAIMQRCRCIENIIFSDGGSYIHVPSFELYIEFLIDLLTRSTVTCATDDAVDLDDMLLRDQSLPAFSTEVGADSKHASRFETQQHFIPTQIEVPAQGRMAMVVTRKVCAITAALFRIVRRLRTLLEQRAFTASVVVAVAILRRNFLRFLCTFFGMDFVSSARFEILQERGPKTSPSLMRRWYHHSPASRWYLHNVALGIHELELSLMKYWTNETGFKNFEELQLSPAMVIFQGCATFDMILWVSWIWTKRRLDMLHRPLGRGSKKSRERTATVTTNAKHIKKLRGMPSKWISCCSALLRASKRAVARKDRLKPAWSKYHSPNILYCSAMEGIPVDLLQTLSITAPWYKQHLLLHCCANCGEKDMSLRTVSAKDILHFAEPRILQDDSAALCQRLRDVLHPVFSDMLSYETQHKQQRKASLTELSALIALTATVERDESAISKLLAQQGDFGVEIISAFGLQVEATLKSLLQIGTVDNDAWLFCEHCFTDILPSSPAVERKGTYLSFDVVSVMLKSYLHSVTRSLCFWQSRTQEATASLSKSMQPSITMMATAMLRVAQALLHTVAEHENLSAFQVNLCVSAVWHLFTNLKPGDTLYDAISTLRSFCAIFSKPEITTNFSSADKFTLQGACLVVFSRWVDILPSRGRQAVVSWLLLSRMSQQLPAIGVLGVGAILPQDVGDDNILERLIELVQARELLGGTDSGAQLHVNSALYKDFSLWILGDASLPPPPIFLTASHERKTQLPLWTFQFVYSKLCPDGCCSDMPFSLRMLHASPEMLSGLPTHLAFFTKKEISVAQKASSSVPLACDALWIHCRTTGARQSRGDAAVFHLGRLLRRLSVVLQCWTDGASRPAQHKQQATAAYGRANEADTLSEAVAALHCLGYVYILLALSECLSALWTHFWNTEYPDVAVAPRAAALDWCRHYLADFTSCWHLRFDLQWLAFSFLRWEEDIVSLLLHLAPVLPLYAAESIKKHSHFSVVAMLLVPWSRVVLHDEILDIPQAFAQRTQGVPRSVEGLESLLLLLNCIPVFSSAATEHFASRQQAAYLQLVMCLAALRMPCLISGPSAATRLGNPQLVDRNHLCRAAVLLRGLSLRTASDTPLVTSSVDDKTDTAALKKLYGATGHAAGLTALWTWLVNVCYVFQERRDVIEHILETWFYLPWNLQPAPSVYCNAAFPHTILFETSKMLTGQPMSSFLRQQFVSLDDKNAFRTAVSLGPIDSGVMQNSLRLPHLFGLTTPAPLNRNISFECGLTPLPFSQCLGHSVGNSFEQPEEGAHESLQQFPKRLRMQFAAMSQKRRLQHDAYYTRLGGGGEGPDSFHKNVLPLTCTSLRWEKRLIVLATITAFHLYSKPLRWPSASLEATKSSPEAAARLAMHRKELLYLVTSMHELLLTLARKRRDARVTEQHNMKLLTSDDIPSMHVALLELILHDELSRIRVWFGLLVETDSTANSVKEGLSSCVTPSLLGAEPDIKTVRSTNPGQLFSHQRQSPSGSFESRRHTRTPQRRNVTGATPTGSLSNAGMTSRSMSVIAASVATRSYRPVFRRSMPNILKAHLRPFGGTVEEPWLSTGGLSPVAHLMRRMSRSASATSSSSSSSSPLSSSSSCSSPEDEKPSLSSGVSDRQRYSHGVAAGVGGIGTEGSRSRAQSFAAQEYRKLLRWRHTDIDRAANGLQKSGRSGETAEKRKTRAFIQHGGKLPSLAALRWSDQKAHLWTGLLQSAWDVAPPVVGQLLERFPTSRSLRRQCRKLATRHSEVVLFCFLAFPHLNAKVLELFVAPEAAWIGTRYFHHDQASARSFMKLGSRCLCSSSRFDRQTIARGDILGSSKGARALSPFPWIYVTAASLDVVLPVLQRHHRRDIFIKQTVVTRTFDEASPAEISRFLPELIQTLRYDPGSIIENFIIATALVYPSLGSNVLFQLSVETAVPAKTEHRRGVVPAEPNYLPFITRRIARRVLQQSNALACVDPLCHSITAQYQFFDSLIRLSGELMSVSPQQREEYLRKKLDTLKVLSETSSPLFWPSEPTLRVKRLWASEAKLMQSASKAPYMLKFEVEKFCGVDALRRQFTEKLISMLGGAPSFFSTINQSDNCLDSVSTIIPAVNPTTVTQRSLIFKLNDDIRQDQLALQIMEVCSYFFQRVNLPLCLRVYHVVPHRTYLSSGKTSVGGMIEVVPNAISRHQLGKMFECSLSDYFRARFSMATSVTYDTQVPETSRSSFSANSIEPRHSLRTPYLIAQWEFLRSLAACSVISFLLQVKDRHNGNLLITQEGHLVHIDFGFLFDLSPGRDLRFEKAPFKLTLEMIEVLGGSAQSKTFQLFEQLVIQGYLTLRQEAPLFLHLVSIIMESGLPCFKKGSLRKLRERFQLDKKPEEAAAYMRRQIITSYNALSTRLYDVVQSIQQGIAR